MWGASRWGAPWWRRLGGASAFEAPGDDTRDVLGSRPHARPPPPPSCARAHTRREVARSGCCRRATSSFEGEPATVVSPPPPCSPGSRSRRRPPRAAGPTAGSGVARSRFRGSSFMIQSRKRRRRSQESLLKLVSAEQRNSESQNSKQHFASATWLGGGLARESLPAPGSAADEGPRRRGPLVRGWRRGARRTAASSSSLAEELILKEGWPTSPSARATA